MEDFKWKQKENYNDEYIKIILSDHRNRVYAEEKADIKKEYEQKVNEFEEKSLFNGLNEKQVTLVKSLLPNYKDLSKSEALNKIKNEYVEIFNNSTDNSNKQEDKPQYFNFADLLKLDEVNKTKQEKSLSQKTKTTSITNHPLFFNNLLALAIISSKLIYTSCLVGIFKTIILYYKIRRIKYDNNMYWPVRALTVGGTIAGTKKAWKAGDRSTAKIKCFR